MEHVLKMTTIKKIKNIQQYRQKSDQWLNQRHGYLTSSDLGSVLGLNPYCSKEEVLFRKCGISDGFKGNEATMHGERYEDECINMYCNLTGRKNTEVGLVPYSALNEQTVINGIDASFLAGSSDGVTVLENDLEEKSINVIEVKCPYWRKNINTIPEYYLPQLKMNLHIMNVEYGDFIQYIPRNHFGSTGGLTMYRFKKDNEWFNDVLPTLRSFWDNVLHYREIGIDKHEKYNYYINKYGIARKTT